MKKQREKKKKWKELEGVTSLLIWLFEIVLISASFTGIIDVVK